MITKKIYRISLILFIIVINIGCDQVSKTVVRNKLVPYETMSFLGSHVTLTRVENPGAFLSLGDSMSRSSRNIVLSLFPLLALLFALVYVLTRDSLSKITLLGICFIIGGGIGNLFDRITYGSVTDFLHIKLGFVQTGIFNMADVSIVIGTLMILSHSIFKKKKETIA